MLYALSIMICVIGSSCETEKPEILYRSEAICQAQAHILAGRERAYLPKDGEIKYGWRCERIERRSTAQLIGK
jgi:hypothetical protein